MRTATQDQRTVDTCFQNEDTRPMSTMTATIGEKDDAPGIIASLLRQFPKGRRIRVSLTDEGEPSVAVPSLDEFMSRIEAARKASPPGPWLTTEEAMHALREGEQD